MAGIFNPERFRVLSNCELGSGVVKSVILTINGNERIDVIPDALSEKLLNYGNMDYQNGSLVLELTPHDPGFDRIPSVGEHITFVGPWVYDLENGWNAICPVWSIQAD